MKCGWSFGSCKFFPMLQAYRKNRCCFLRAQCFREVSNVHIKWSKLRCIYDEYDMENCMFSIEFNVFWLNNLSFEKFTQEYADFNTNYGISCLNVLAYITVCITLYLRFLEQKIFNKLVALKMMHYFCSIIIIIDFYIKT